MAYKKTETRTLTDGWLKQQQGARTVKDSKVEKLVCRISPKGKKSWALDGKIQGRHISKKLGTFQLAPGKKNTPVQMTTVDARDAAKAMENRMTDPDALVSPAVVVPTLAEAFQLHLETNPKGNEAETLKYHQQRFENYVQDFRVKVAGVGCTLGSVTLDKIESFHLDDLKASVIQQCSDRLEAQAAANHKKQMTTWMARGKKGDRPARKEVADTAGARTANMVLARLTTVFLFSIRRKLVPLGWVKPKADEGAQEAGQDETNHIRIQQAGAFYSAVEALRNRAGYKVENNGTIADLILACLWTGGRKGNVMAMQWAHLDLAEGVWRIPRAEYKSRKKMTTSHKTIPLVAPVVDLLKARQGRDPTWVFNSHGGGHITDFRKSWAWVKQEAGIQHRLTIHGLRHSLGTWLHQAGAPLKAIAGQLGQADLDSAARYAANDTSHLQGLTTQALQASFTVVDDDPDLISIDFTQDEAAQLLEALKGNALAGKISAATGLKLVE